MNVEYTARKYVITPNIRKEVETGLNKIRKILGDRFETKVILAVEKRRHKAEITIDPPHGPIVGLAQTDDMMSAVNEALDHLQKQALKHKTKWLSKKRKAVKKFDGQSLEDNMRRRSDWRKVPAFPFWFTNFHRWREPPKCIWCMRRTRSRCVR